MVLLSLLILFVIGRIILFFADQFKPAVKLTPTEVVVYSFSLGYVALTFAGIVLAEFKLLTPSTCLFLILTLPFLLLCAGLYQRQRVNPQHAVREIRGNPLNQAQTISDFFRRFFHPSLRLSYLALLVVYSVGIILRLEGQLTVPWLGDMDPYYHLFFIDSIIMQGELPSRTLWGFYSYPPSFHVVPTILIATTQVDRFAFMKMVPEFLGFLCVPTVYTLTKRHNGEWAGVASAAFLAITSFHIYRTNIAIPESIAILGMLLFFHAITVQGGMMKCLRAGFFFSMVLLANVISILYFLPCVLAMLLALLLLRRWNESYKLLMATLLGLIFSGLFWLPTLYKLGFKGISEGLGPGTAVFQYSGASLNFTSHTYFSWIGWGPCILAIVGVYECLKDFRSYLSLLIPSMAFIILIEAANNGYYVFESAQYFRGLLYLGTWISLLAGVGFRRINNTNLKPTGGLESQKVSPHPNGKIKTIAVLSLIVVLTAASFPVISGARYPVNWEYHDLDFVYRSYLNNYIDIFKGEDYKVYSKDWETNYGAFRNVILDREAPQIAKALIQHDVSTLLDLLHENKIRYLIFRSGTAEVKFLTQTKFFSIYYSNWHTTVLAVKED